MSNVLNPVRIGLAMVLLGLAFGVTLGVSFGLDEKAYHDHISAGIEAHPALHDEKSAGSIWRYARRAHFHATGISAFSLGLVLLIALTSMKASAKRWSAILVGLSGFYPLSWFTMYWLSPSIGRHAAHTHMLTELCVYVGVGGLLLGLLMIFGYLFLGLFSPK